LSANCNWLDLTVVKLAFSQSILRKSILRKVFKQKFSSKSFLEKLIKQSVNASFK